MSYYLLTEDISSLLTADILSKLSQIKVNSVKDLLLLNLSKIRSISRNKEIDFKTLLKIKGQLYKRFGPKKINGFEMISKVIGFETGIEMFDKMVVNGIRRGELTEIYGYSNSGKTQFCYTFAANLIHKYNKKVLFIDTDLCFSELKFEQMLKMGHKDFNDIKSNLKVKTILDIHSLLDTIESISNDLKTNNESEYKDLGLVIIDSLSTLIAQALKKHLFEAEVEEKQNHNLLKAKNMRYRLVAMISQLANTLNYLANEHSLAVIVVNTESLKLKSNWKNYFKLCLHFYSIDEQSVDDYKGIKINKTYDKSIENNSYEKFEIKMRGFV